ncbi:MAG: SPFH domain-containing protein, partial [Bacteroidales bacterium]|nr:SPFH domain-containing protein [Bacteroidales bacterium]
MKKTNIILLVVGAAALISLAAGAYIIDETEQAIVTQFGKPVGEPRTNPGLQFRIPFIQKVQFFDKRYLEWDGDSNQVPSKDKRFIHVDTYARWQIS